MPEYKNVKYIAGRVLKIGDRFVQPGEEVDPSIFPRIEAFVGSGRLYRVYEGKGYDRLPPWLFTAVMKRKEAEAKIEGDHSPILAVHDDAHRRHQESREVRVANAEAIIRQEGPGAHEKALAARGEQVKDEPKPEPKPAAKPAPKKTTSKKES